MVQVASQDRHWGGYDCFAGWAPHRLPAKEFPVLISDRLSERRHVQRSGRVRQLVTSFIIIWRDLASIERSMYQVGHALVYSEILDVVQGISKQKGGSLALLMLHGRHCGVEIEFMPIEGIDEFPALQIPVHSFGRDNTVMLDRWIGNLRMSCGNVELEKIWSQRTEGHHFCDIGRQAQILGCSIISANCVTVGPPP